MHFWKVSFSSIHTSIWKWHLNSGKCFWKVQLWVTVFTGYVRTGRQSKEKNVCYEMKTDMYGWSLIIILLNSIRNSNFWNLGEEHTQASTSDNIRHPKLKAYEPMNAIFNNKNYDEWKCSFKNILELLTHYSKNSSVYVNKKIWV